jgi:hypothetical protein
MENVGSYVVDFGLQVVNKRKEKTNPARPKGLKGKKYLFIEKIKSSCS